MSQLLAKLKKELSNAVDPVDRAELQARIACNLARNGTFGEAEVIVRELRSGFGDGRSGRVTIWIMLAEGLIHWYSEMSPKGLDRIVRAQLLSSAMKYGTGIAVSSAWKAHIEFELSNFEAMFRSIQLSMQHASTTDHDAMTRVAVVMANASALAGDGDGAKIWFMKGREHALKDGDLASIDALQFNRAALALSWIRAETFLGNVDLQAIRRVRMELDSSRNLNAMTGIAALDNHLRMCQARLLILEENFDQAIADLTDVRSGHPFAAYHFNATLVDLEIAFCKFRLNRCDDAFNLYRTLDFSTIGDLQLDDQLVAACLRHELSATDSRFGDADSLERQKHEIGATYANWHSELREGLRKFSVELAKA
jgi:hypothetical protein